MPRPGLVTRQELREWADSVAAPRVLPHLIRRMILETGDGVTAVDFPAAEGTAAGGWDGVAHTTRQTPFVPEGLSLWELSTSTKVKDKPDEDYEKRTTTPDGSPTTQATYCEVILRPWTKRREWATK